MSDSKMDEMLRRIERIEEELKALRGKGASSRVKSERPSPEEKKVVDGVKELLLDSFPDRDRLMMFMALEKRLIPSKEEEGKKETFWDTWAIVEPGFAEDVDTKRVSELLISCSSETRLKILYEVHKTPKYPKELTALTGLSGGALYHHLDILTEAELIERDKMNRIVRTVDGELFCDLIFNLDKIGKFDWASAQVEGRDRSAE